MKTSCVFVESVCAAFTLISVPYVYDIYYFGGLRGSSRPNGSCLVNHVHDRLLLVP